MTSWTAADLPSFAGRTVIVTGANSGLGEVTARELARVGAQVILAVRNTGKGEAAAREMTGDVEVRQLDLQDLASVRQFADGVDSVDVLVNNAGIMAVPHAVTADGFESQIGTNHLGHFALTNLLLPKAHRPGGDGVLADALDGLHQPARPELDVTALLGVAGLRPVQARQPAVHQRAAAATRGGALAAAGAGRPSRLLAHQPAGAIRAARSVTR